MWISFGEGFLLVFAINDKYSFDILNEKRKRILKTKHKDYVPMVLVGNKQDLDNNLYLLLYSIYIILVRYKNERKVSYEEPKQLADSWGIEYIETSAKTNYNCKEAFEKLIIEISSTKIKPKKSSCCNCNII